MDTFLQKNHYYFPQNYPMNFSGKLTTKIVQKTDYVRKDGTCAMYVQVFVNQERIRIPLSIFVEKKHFDTVKQRVKKTHHFATDFNLLIEKSLSDLSTIELFYRLSNLSLTSEILLNEYHNPSSRTDFIKFWEQEMENQRLILRESTYNQQLSVLRKVKRYKSIILFHEISLEFVNKVTHCFRIGKWSRQCICETYSNSYSSCNSA